MEEVIKRILLIFLIIFGFVSCAGDSDSDSTAAQVAAMVSDMGTSTVSASIVITHLADSAAYDYSFVFTLPSSDAITIMVKNSDSKIAAHHASAGSNKDPWVFTLDTAAGTLVYESIDISNYRRMRVSIDGTIDTSTYEFSSVSTVEGFWMQGSSGSYSIG